MRLHACLATLVLVLAAVSGRVMAQDGYTDHPEPMKGPAGVITGMLIDAINTRNEDAFLKVIREHAVGPFRDQIPESDHLDVFRQVCRETGGLEYFGYRTYDPPRAETDHVVIVRDRRMEDWRALVIMLDPADPTKLSGLQFAPARRPSTLPVLPPLDHDSAIRELDERIERLAAADAFSGTVLVAQDGRVLYERAIGLASRRFDVPNDMDTKFNLGSMNKMFTATAIMKLAESGALTLDERLSEYIDESWLDPAIASQIELRHLLNHTSGLGSYFNKTFWDSSRAKFRVLDDYKPLVRGETLAFPPGTDWQYSNTGFFLLGVVVEKVTGQTYFDYVHDALFEPAGMTNTACYEMDRPVPNLAIGYIPDVADDGTETWSNNLYMHVIKGGPAGGGFSTARDLLRFDVALRAGRLVSPESRDALWTARPDEHSPTYGYGFAVEDGPLGRAVGHGGGFPGLNSQLDMYLDSGVTVVVMSNIDGGASPVAQTIAQLMLRVE